MKFVRGTFAVFLFATLAAQSTSPPGTSRLQKPDPVFDALGERLPAPAEWPSWIAEHDRTPAAVWPKGDETSIVYWLLFGTTFTSQPVSPRARSIRRK